MNPELLKKLRAMFTGANMPTDAARVAQVENSGSQSGSALEEARRHVTPWAHEPARRLYTSPTADSLFRITGVPSFLDDLWSRQFAGTYQRNLHNDPDQKAILAQLYNTWHTASINRGMSDDERARRKADLDSALKRLEERYPDHMTVDPDAPAIDYSPNRNRVDARGTLLHEGAHRMQAKLHPAMRGYRDRSEEEADMFASVFDFLSKTGTPADTANAEERLLDIARKYYETPNGPKMDSSRRFRDVEGGLKPMAREILADESRVFRGHPLRQMFGLQPEPRPVPVSSEEFLARLNQFKRQ